MQCPNGTNGTEPFICTEIHEYIPTTELRDEAPTTEIEAEAVTTELKNEVATTELKAEETTTGQIIIQQTETIANTINNCFYSCKSCFDQGDEINNKCTECKEGFTFLDEFINKTNCFKKCPYYYYFNESNQYLCTENEVCPEHYTKFITKYKKCIDECKNDEIYKYENNNICYEQCPNGTNETGDYICIQNESNETILYQCSNNNALVSACSIRGANNNTDIYNIIINQILSDYSPDNNKSQVIEGVDNTIYHLTTEKNEIELLNEGGLSNNYSLPIIDLGDCESILKDEYDLNEDDTLIYLKKEILSDKSSEKDIEFEVYEPYNKTQLNLSLCYTTDINIYVRLELSSETEALNEKMKELGYNMFDINDPFYTDICTPYKSSGKTDMLLSDRIDYIYNNEDAQCQSNCQFSGYLFDSQYINCTCNVNHNEEKETVKVEKFKPKKLYESFFEVLKYSNYKILKCYKLIGNKRIITKNIENIMLIIFFIFYLVSLISYIIRGIKPLKIKLEEIVKIEEDGKNILNGDIKIFSKNVDDKIINEMKTIKRKTINKNNKGKKDNKRGNKNKKENKKVNKNKNNIINKKDVKNNKKIVKKKSQYPPKKGSNNNKRKTVGLEKSKSYKSLNLSKSRNNFIKRNNNYDIFQSQKRPLNRIFNKKKIQAKKGLREMR